MNNNDDIDSKIQKMKENLSAIHNELLSEIKGKPINQIQNEDTQSMRIPKIIENIKETIQLLLEKRIEDFKKDNTPSSPIKSPISKQSLKEYEAQLRQYEDNIRKQYKREIIVKISLGVSKHRIEGYEAMEDEFEEMKEKLKYEDGQFLNNDRKDNEILILRAENINLKAEASNCEKRKKETNNRKDKNQETIAKLKAKIDKLAKKIESIEKNQIEIDSKSNSSINININNGHSASKLIIKGDLEGNHMLSSNTTVSIMLI